jgi:hypothetical protein
LPVLVHVEQVEPAPRVRFAWLAPDLAFVAAAVTLFYCLFLFQGYQKLFRDSDAGWHIRNGETILATHQLPHTDPYSFTCAGQPWLAWEWGSDVLVGAVHRAAGLSGVALFYAVIIAAGVWLWFRLHWALHGNFLLACAMAPLLLSTCNIHWLARPHTIGWLFLLAAVLYAETAGRRANLITIGVFVALWANLHASFFLAPVIALTYAVRRSGSWRWAAVVTLLAPLANPYGSRLYQHVFRYLTDSALLSRIGEFQSFDFHTPGAAQIIITLMLAIAGGTLALTLGRVEHFVLALLISSLALRSARALPLAALLLLPIANSAITEALTSSGKWRSFRAYWDRLRALDAGMSGLAWVPILLLASWALLRTPGIAIATGFPPDQFPVAAYTHIPAEARLFAPDKYGGYLIYRSNGAMKVFFDGRSDFYGADFLKQYGRLVQVRPGWREYWESFHFTHALLPPDAPLLAALEQIGWYPIYGDKTVTLLAKGRT